ncbi:UDP-N-acetylmuramoyl-L-alanyl-D-glutamate--2,6-diaminopimelate ligase [Tenacibaculum finnmarkense]|uniref:UDP-N-acetylmuramoyl-L-alanyl-D-glutamate--2,6-diaminopimelate ligase n=1 Tax=Tenacibaculum finnmarkense genomovar finnmarkense TaxID=1458503 RepID=A0AAP1RH19_9FLAO|nr:UDP-N-acetylmuramoyl-L-alanyl-D-glutamate--2,6-diaminopimelate ligase [Tenacibaculum finnmarkense]MBE7653545.1 UDP-N-acetylmuramoyl-L-alanyl-D-glutamate--2,6-diaminopimelate ligase [Tenacibaculum finnmarkense genomovar finnmarkense]MBE7695863.1 UDP-N-acetylmuramoyl-L-alanyl-D-glutamate--2,6-diaminopimelate ligase [Tenacibaculum finnmarkense genomovar finnmarkense]MCD8440077.1 UDP-N-acetylmuramoyl-L-alanyl-D-glutamate--2,6-diaminopimelate ligase [Tenacibaculum finnmarkense genomovar ulcerans]
MKKLKDILYKVSVNKIYGTIQASINEVVFDSRLVQKNDVFIAQKGGTVDGHQFIEKAIDLGATVIVCQDIPSDKKQDITYVEVTDSDATLAIMAANFYDNPSKKLQLVGITGTNGKTTIASLLYQLFKKAGHKVGLLSTVKIMVDDKEHKATHTTPNSLAINKYLSLMIDAGVTHCFMEVSSHGIHQKRTEGLHFVGGVFTNLSHDHLDYHKTFAEYRDVKKSFFDVLPKSAFALVNIDDKNGQIMLQNTKAKKQTYALKTLADFKGKVLEKRFSGSLLYINAVEVWTKLIGEFNASNLLAIFGVANLLGLEKLETLRLISDLESVSGRFEYVISGDGVTAVVDYAHTPDALKNVLQTINDIRTDTQNIFTVVGCGGDRDTTKRPKMALIAAQLSSQAIFTSDNPRTENPQLIIDQMEAGVSAENYKKTLSVLNRKQAIKTACKLAKTGDIILIAGKGHEDYQEINGVKHHFDDLEEVKNCFNQLKKA